MDKNLNQPLVSIILPTYNGSKTIANSIQSVINQTYSHWELIVINDGSTDSVAQIISDFQKKEPRLVLYNQNNQGLGQTRRNGVEKAKGQYIALIDDDDYWNHPQKLEKQVTFMESNPEHVLCGAQVVNFIDEAGQSLFHKNYPQLDQDIKKNILKKNCFAASSTFFRKDSYEKAGGFKPHRYVEDYDLWLRMGVHGKFANLESFTIDYTVRKNSLTGQNQFPMSKLTLKLVLKHLKHYPSGLQATFFAVLRVLYYGLNFIINKIKRHG